MIQRIFDRIAVSLPLQPNSASLEFAVYMMTGRIVEGHARGHLVLQKLDMEIPWAIHNIVQRYPLPLGPEIVIKKLPIELFIAICLNCLPFSNHMDFISDFIKPSLLK